MPLQSSLLRSDRHLIACLQLDSAHVTPGATGEHVAKIQTAVSRIDGYSIASTEIWQQRYGPSTAAAVLAYKRKRKIINRNYQTQADNIVGKMTIAALDADMLRVEHTPRPPELRQVWQVG